jgi:poly(A) polymerase
VLDSLRSYFEADDGAELGAAVRAAVVADPVTILRLGARIAHHGAPAPAAMTRACREEVELLRDVPVEQIRDGLTELLLGRDVDLALEWLHDLGVTGMFLPELDATRDLEQEAGRRHKDVWQHTKIVVKQAVRRPGVRWAALLHDIGKVSTRTFTRNGVHFHGHAEVGARMFDKIARRMPFDDDLRKKIRFLIKHHLRSNQYSDGWTDSAVRRFGREMDSHLQDLLDLSRADITSKRPGRRQELLRQISALQARIERLRAEDAKVPPLGKGLGTAIIERFALRPCKFVGELKRALEQAIERGELEPRKDDDYYLAWLQHSGLIDAAPPSARAQPTP